MERTIQLNAGVPTENPCLLILRDRGYQLRIRCYRKTSDDSVRVLYFANKDEIALCGHSAAELLGLVTLWETYGEDWRRQEPDVVANAIEEEVDND